MLFLAPFADSRIIPGKGGILPGLHSFPGGVVILTVRCYKVWNFRMYAVTVGTVKTPEIKGQLAPGFILDVSAFAVFHFYLQIAHRAANGMFTIPDFYILDLQEVDTDFLNYRIQTNFFACLFFTMM